MTQTVSFFLKSFKYELRSYRLICDHCISLLIGSFESLCFLVHQWCVEHQWFGRWFKWSRIQRPCSSPVMLLQEQEPKFLTFWRFWPFGNNPVSICFDGLPVALAVRHIVQHALHSHPQPIHGEPHGTTNGNPKRRQSKTTNKHPSVLAWQFCKKGWFFDRNSSAARSNSTSARSRAIKRGAFSYCARSTSNRLSLA